MPLSLKYRLDKGSSAIKLIKNLPVWQAVLDVVEGRVDKNAAIVPSTRLDADGLVDEAALP